MRSVRWGDYLYIRNAAPDRYGRETGESTGVAFSPERLDWPGKATNAELINASGPLMSVPGIVGVYGGPDHLILRFEGMAGVSGWKITGSADLQDFSINETGNATITETSPGTYEAVIDVSEGPPRYFFRIKR